MHVRRLHHGNYSPICYEIRTADSCAILPIRNELWGAWTRRSKELTMAYDIIRGKTRRDWSCGSIALPEKQERRILAKIDDVRYDVRQAAGKASIGLYSLAAAAAFLGVTQLLKKRT